VATELRTVAERFTGAPDGRYTAHTLRMLGPYARLRLTGPDLFLFHLEIDDMRGSQNFVSEMARRYDGHR